MQLPARLGSTLALALVALLVAACSQLPSAVPAGQGPLVTVELRGGLCPAGTCSTTVTLERDGRVHQAVKPPNDLGIVPPAALAALDAAIRTTDFAALRRHPFTGECPTAYDGQEIVFGFGAPGGTERVATCEVAVDFASPLFVAVSTALGPFVPLPSA
jgi:hypothetical protein